MEKVFEEYSSETAIDAISLISKNGVPIASHLKDEEITESFSTLSATILGANEVIFSEFEKEEPELITGESADTVLLIKEVDSNTVLSVLTDSGMKDEMIDKMEGIISEIGFFETSELAGVKE
ncbi:MAG: roadblock/LC7 domain-containing protein [Thermoplasmata archaeon]